MGKINGLYWKYIHNFMFFGSNREGDICHEIAPLILVKDGQFAIARIEWRKEGKHFYHPIDSVKAEYYPTIRCIHDIIVENIYSINKESGCIFWDDYLLFRDLFEKTIKFPIRNHRVSANIRYGDDVINTRINAIIHVDSRYDINSMNKDMFYVIANNNRSKFHQNMVTYSQISELFIEESQKIIKKAKIYNDIPADYIGSKYYDFAQVVNSKKLTTDTFIRFRNYISINGEWREFSIWEERELNRLWKLLTGKIYSVNNNVGRVYFSIFAIKRETNFGYIVRNSLITAEESFFYNNAIIELLHTNYPAAESKHLYELSF